MVAESVVLSNGEPLPERLGQRVRAYREWLKRKEEALAANPGLPYEDLGHRACGGRAEIEVEGCDGTFVNMTITKYHAFDKSDEVCLNLWEAGDLRDFLNKWLPKEEKSESEAST